MRKFEANLDKVIANIEKARLEVSAHHIVKIIAVSKYSTSEDIRALYELGHRAYGENKVQDLIQKSDELDELPIEWHFIGRLQKNKINHLIEQRPFLVQSIDGIEMAKEIDKRLKVKEQTFDALMQINSANEDTKAGVSKEASIEQYLQIQKECSSINLKGVMSIGAHTDNNSDIIKSFEDTYSIYESLQKSGATICSMGMSSDYELAIKCGSNMVRVGSSIFK
jgi:pyridoxal phosphate enzyme (YggS family)